MQETKCNYTIPDILQTVSIFEMIFDFQIVKTIRDKWFHVYVYWSDVQKQLKFSWKLFFYFVQKSKLYKLRKAPY